MWMQSSVFEEHCRHEYEKKGALRLNKGGKPFPQGIFALCNTGGTFLRGMEDLLSLTRKDFGIAYPRHNFIFSGDQGNTERRTERQTVGCSVEKYVCSLN